MRGELVVEFLRRKKRFHELILEAWSGLEFDVDQLVTRQFGLDCDYRDKKVQFLLGSSFEQKLQFLKKVGVVNSKEFHIIKGFQERRNRFFHTLGTAEMAILTKEEREQTIDEAVKVTKLGLDLVWRAPPVNGPKSLPKS